MVVTWVDPSGPAAGVLAIGDVIESSDGQPVLSPDHWRVQLARLSAGQVLTLRVRGHNEERDVSLQVQPPAQPATETSALGLRMRRAPRVGTELLAVDPGSAGARGGLVPGDTITVIGDISAPAPAQIARTFSSAPQGTPIVVGVTRGTTHLVTTLSR